MYIYTIYCINYTVVASVSHEEDILDKFWYDILEVKSAIEDGHDSDQN